jgi:hypothetical protein
VRISNLQTQEGREINFTSPQLQIMFMSHLDPWSRKLQDGGPVADESQSEDPPVENFKSPVVMIRRLMTAIDLSSVTLTGTSSSSNLCPIKCCFGNHAELTGQGRKRLGSQLIAMGMQADGASKYLLLLASKSSLSLEQQDAIDQAQLMCETALKLLKTDNGRDEALKNALDGLHHSNIVRDLQDPMDLCNVDARLPQHRRQVPQHRRQVLRLFQRRV